MASPKKSGSPPAMMIWWTEMGRSETSFLKAAMWSWFRRAWSRGMAWQGRGCLMWNDDVESMSSSWTGGDSLNTRADNASSLGAGDDSSGTGDKCYSVSELV